MKRVTFRSLTAVGALMVAGIAGLAVQSADAERLDGQTEAQPMISQSADPAPAGITASPPIESKLRTVPENSTPAPAENVPLQNQTATRDAPPPAPVPLAGQEKEIRVVPIQRDVKEVPAPTAAPNKTVNVQVAPETNQTESKRHSMEVLLDLATVMRMPKETTTIVVGNPIIADTTVQNSGMLVITGKSHGTTNIMALNNNGDLIKELMVTVVSSNPPSSLTVQRGMERETWSCSTACQRTITLGDGGSYFGEVSSQASSRNSVSQGSASGNR